ncbi:hypothetical protein [Fulvivirga sedimenti]|uniref:Uncharacterized protein n=1 Tax=Fulvivirga sedimenti TaxID=2879465 RepID=A0A9X1HQ21_9BACT|nr:hypothetical protein [Fulvivirga sedimenti]MCA6074873.1 hypothetical protein [Fulvivirga sedimenti]MCA6076050.1 hypothetical protein [Fulvivirga sedimenti]MCA6077178.1 hypothetical protein [Fulvivirga sedimenti]
MKSRIYHEVQYMRQTVFMYIMTGFVALTLGGMAFIFLTENKERDTMEMIISSGIAMVVLFFLTWLLYSLYLDVRIEEGRIIYRMPPLVNKEKSISRTDINSYEVVKYPIRHYGGWGVRYSFKHGKALTISGTRGLKLHLKSGQTLLLGTRNPEGIKNAMERMMKNESDYV